MSIVFGGQKRKCVIKRHQCAELLRNFAAYCVISRHNLLDHAHQRKRLSPLAHGSFPRLLSQNNRLARETRGRTGECKSWTLDWTMDWTMDWNMDSILDAFS